MHDATLLDPPSLPRAESPRQRPKNPPQRLCREPATCLSTKNSLPRATVETLGKDFAEGQKRPRQSPRGRRKTSKLTSLPRVGQHGSRQRLFNFFLKKKSLSRACQAGPRQRRALPRASRSGSRQRPALPRAYHAGSRQSWYSDYQLSIFAECWYSGSRQSWAFFFWFFYLFFTCTATYHKSTYKSQMKHIEVHRYHKST